MLLNLKIIALELKNRGYNVSLYEHSYAAFYSHRVYTGEPLTRQLLYLIRPEQLAFLNDPETGCALVCAGIASLPDPGFAQDVLLIREDPGTEGLLNLISEITDRYDYWEHSLFNAEHSYEGLQHMLDISASFLSGTLILADGYFNYQLFTREFQPIYAAIIKNSRSKTPDFVVDDILTNPEYHRIRNLREPFTFPIHLSGTTTRTAVCVNLFSTEEKDYIGRLMFYNDSENYDDTVLYLMNILAQKVGAVYRTLPPRLNNNAIFNSLREMIRSCLTGQPSAESFAELVVRNAGWKLSDRYVLIKFVSYFVEARKEFNAISLSEIEALYPKCCGVTYGEDLLLLVNLTRSELSDDGVFRVGFVSFLRDRLYKAGVSVPFNGFMGIRSAFRETDAALTLGNIRNGTFWYHVFSDYALDYMIQAGSKEIDRENLCRRELIRLREYDAAHDTDYFNALYVYLSEKQNATHAADRLFIHRTTLLKYLDRIDSLTKLDLDDWDTVLHLMMSYRILKKDEMAVSGTRSV